MDEGNERLFRGGDNSEGMRKEKGCLWGLPCEMKVLKSQSLGRGKKSEDPKKRAWPCPEAEAQVSWVSPGGSQRSQPPGKPSEFLIRDGDVRGSGNDLGGGG